MRPSWPDANDAVALHEELVATFGGSHGLRSRADLESAIARPQQLYAYQEPQPAIPDLAAALAYSLIRNHPFVDGNKRIAFAMLGAFLDVNWWELSIPQEYAAEVFENLAAGTLSEEDFTQTIRNYCAPFGAPAN